jgi:acetolactate synthase-1/2/3 large subunit
MPDPDHPRTGADILVRRLRDHGVRHVFGYPGGQLTPLYDALYREPAIRHVLARDEQAAAFMADGYARATGRPGVCLAVCGPGVYNAATPLATAFTDSVPVLLISGQIPTRGAGIRSGYYHENDQLSACATFTKRQVRVDEVHNLIPEFDRCFAALTDQRPGPVLFEVPLDVQRDDALEGLADHPWPPVAPGPLALEPDAADVRRLAELLEGCRKPVIVAGGGVVAAGAEELLVRIAERLGAPVFNTLLGKCALPSDHALNRGLPWHRATSDLTNMGSLISPLFSQADGMLAVGCRFTQATTGNWTMPVPPTLAQIDIDAAEIGRHYPVALGIQADARQALRALLAVLPGPRPSWAPTPSAREPWRLPGLDLVGPLRRVLPRDAVVVADITRLAYILLAEFPVYQPRTFLHPAGFVAMGYGIPAALGAKVALPERVVLAVVGDGCFLMSGMELATAVQEKVPIVVVLVNDGSLTLIKAIQQRRYEGRFLGVDLRNPDFGQLARAFGVAAWQVHSDTAFEAALREAIASGGPALVEVHLENAQSP